MNDQNVARVKVTGDEKRNLWSKLNTVLLVFLSIVGFFVVRWMNDVESKLKDVVTSIGDINRTITVIQEDRQYEKGREAGRREILNENWVVPKNEKKEK